MSETNEERYKRQRDCFAGVLQSRALSSHVWDDLANIHDECDCHYCLMLREVLAEIASEKKPPKLDKRDALIEQVRELPATLYYPVVYTIQQVLFYLLKRDEERDKE